MYSVSKHLNMYRIGWLNISIIVARIICREMIEQAWQQRVCRKKSVVYVDVMKIKVS